MKIKKYLKTFLNTLILFFLIFNNLGQTAFAISASDLPIKIHLGKFTYKNPSPVVSNTSKEAGTNYDPHFSLKDPKQKEAWKYVEGCDGTGCQEPIITTVEQGNAIVYPRIQGLTIIKLSYLKVINDNNNKFTKFSQPVIFSKFILSIVPDQNIIKDYYLAIPSSYQQFKLLDSGISPLFSIMKTLGLATESPIDFYAGVSHIKPDVNDIIKNKIVAELQGWFPNFGSAIEPSLNNMNETTIQNVKNAFNIKDNLNTAVFINETQKKQLDGQLQSVASGACYEIKPTGTQNLCTNTIKQNCKTDTANHIYFLHGISCEILNNLFAFPEHSAAINTETKAYKEQINPAQPKEKTIFQPQVSFGGITTGISLPDYINLIYKYLMGFSLVVTGFVIVIGGAKYMIGKNDGIPMIKNAFIGFIILSGTYIILKTVNPATVNLNIIEIGEIKKIAINVKPGATGGDVSYECSRHPNLVQNYLPIPDDKKNPIDFYYNSINFNPHCVLANSDTEWNDDTKMTIDEVQNFLNKYNGTLKSYTGYDHVLKKQATAAETILKAAERVQLSPKLLLVFLEKEQSLVTQQIPKGKGIDWALGYGWCDTCGETLNTPLADTPENKQKIENYNKYWAPLFGNLPEKPSLADMYKGFDKQIYRAASGIKSIMKYNPTVKVGKPLVTYDFEGSPFIQKYLSKKICIANGIKQSDASKASLTKECSDFINKIISEGTKDPNNINGHPKNLPYKWLKTHEIPVICPGNEATAALYNYTPHVIDKYNIIQIYQKFKFTLKNPLPECAANISQELLNTPRK